MSANRDRLYITKKYRTLIDDSIKDNKLGIKDLQNLDRFKIAVALGINKPIDFDGAKDGYFLMKDLKTVKDFSFFRIVKLSNAKTNDEIDEFVDLEANFEESERCANSGFLELEKILNQTSDEELLQKRMFEMLDTLYQKNVKLS